jgi:hypothetical protein
MFYLPPISAKDRQAYLDSVSARILTAKTASVILPQSAKLYIENNLDDILGDAPGRLMRHHKAILPLLDPQLTLAEYERYYLAKQIKQGRTLAEDALVAQYTPVLDGLGAVFNYNKFISGHKITSYDLAKMLDRNTCTYCNRSYTVTVIYKDDNTGRVNNSTRVVRPAFDHWFPKSKYPVLSMSLYNLIPSCPLCNSSIKGDTDMSLRSYLHPYTNVPKQAFSFDYLYEDVHANNVMMRVKPQTKSARTLTAFKIKEVYDAHSAFELKDLLEIRYKYSENYLETLFRSFSLPVTEKEAYRMIFGVEYDDELHHRRPFSKFKKDILAKLGIKNLK